MDYFFHIELKNIWKMVLKKKLFTNDCSVIITTLRHVFSEKIIITAVNNGARTVYRYICTLYPLALSLSKFACILEVRTSKGQPVE